MVLRDSAKAPPFVSANSVISKIISLIDVDYQMECTEYAVQRKEEKNFKASVSLFKWRPP